MVRIPAEAYAPLVDALVYDETCPSCLRWRASGKPAGCQEPKGYFLVRFGPKPGRLFKAHRIVWFLHHGTVPDLLDHRDDDQTNTRIGNLRVATESQNRHNSKKHRDGAAGAKGLSLDPRTEKWAVKVMVNGVSHWGGRFTEKADAVARAKELRNTHHKDFSRHD